MRIATLGHLLRGTGENTEVLLGERQSHFCNGIWNGPGGKIEPGEKILNCLAREITEEVYSIIDLSSAKLFANVDFYHPRPTGHSLEWRVHFFRISRWKRQPKPKVGFSKLNWFKVNDLPYHLMMPDQKEWLPTAIMDGFSRLINVETYYADPELKTVEKIELKFVDKPKRS